MALIASKPGTVPAPALGMVQHRDSRICWIAGAALVVAVFVCFSPAFSAEFLSWDDHDNLVGNVHYRGFGPENLRWMFTSFLLGHYQPLSWLSFALDHALWGMDPSGYHFTNILLHAVNAVLFFLLARRLIHIGVAGGDPQRGAPARSDLTITAALAAAFWAIHPLRVESVAWATERRDVLSTLFMLASGLVYLGAVEVGNPRMRSWRSYWIACALLLLSCLSKAWGMSFFVMLILLDWYPLRRLPANPLRWFTGPGLRVLIEKAPMVLIGIATAVVAANAQHSANAAKTLSKWPIEGRILQSLYGLWFYARETIAPSNLSPLYQLPAEVNPWEGRYLVSYAFVLVAGAFILFWWRRRPDAPGPAVAAGMYVVTLAPVLGILQSGEQMVADRYSYIAAMPLSVMAALGGLALYRLVVARAKEEAGRAGALLWTMCGIGLLSLAALTYSQTTVWHDSLRLWTHATEVAPCSYAFDYLGEEFLTRGRADDAGQQFAEATELWPEDGRAWFCLANILKDKGRKAEAEQAYLRAIPTLVVAYQAHQNLGIMYLDQGRKDEGYKQFELAVADLEDASKGRRPMSGGPYMVLGLARKEQGRVEEAAALFQKAEAYHDTQEDARKQLKALGK